LYPPPFPVGDCGVAVIVELGPCIADPPPGGPPLGGAATATAGARTIAPAAIRRLTLLFIVEVLLFRGGPRAR